MTAELNPGHGMVIDGVIAAETIDSSGEIIEVAGADISSLEKDGTLNTEHMNPEDAKGDSPWSVVIGRCIKARKIFSEEDCEDDRQKFFWNLVKKVPYIYGQFRLFDGSGHKSAQEAAAIIRDTLHAGEPPLVNFSIEGTTIEKEGIYIKKCICRRVAGTLKPCNKAAISGVVSDPNGPPMPDAKKQKRDILGGMVEDAKKFERNGMERIGGYIAQYDPTVPLAKATDKVRQAIVALEKTLSAGMPSGSPSSLVGGAALQREDLRRKMSPAVKAAVRDWDPAAEPNFRKFLKFRLPEVSDKFIDRFADLVDDFRVKRSQLLTKKAAEVKVDESTAQPNPTPKTPEPAPIDDPKFQVKKVKAKKGVHFDENEGVLHTPSGSFRVYIPPHDDTTYQKVLADPQINEIHQRAMKQWIGLHRLARAGQLPPEVVAHAALFSAMSPNTAVPIQELAYGFLQDLHERGFDPTKLHTKEEKSKWEAEWKKMTAGQHLPEYMRDTFENPKSGVYTKAGKRQQIGLGDQKIKGALGYGEIHDMTHYLMNSSGGDARETSGILNYLKSKAGTKQAKGLPSVFGFAPKTIRYLLGMSGGGNVVVPDTHFIRHTFGLGLGDPRNEQIKQHLWDAKNEPALAALDRYYYRHHPAVAATQKMFKEQHGEDLGEHAIFPAFWLHWLTIQAHDRERGWDSRAHNADTDHAVYWNRVHHVLNKYRIPHDEVKKFEGAHDASMPARTAHAYAELERDFGHVGASLAYYASMVPALQGGHDPFKRFAKAVQQLNLVLRKDDRLADTVPTKTFRGNRVQPGEVEILKGPGQGHRLELLHVSPTHHYVRGHPFAGVVKLSNAEMDAGFRVNRPHDVVENKGVVKADQHGLPHLSNHPTQVALLDGLDLSNHSRSPAAQFKGGVTNSLGWRKSSSGAVGYVKEAGLKGSANHDDFIDHPDLFPAPHREAAFHVLARDFFGMGDHVPVTAAFKHPATGEPHSIQQGIVGAEHFSNYNDQHHAVLNHANLTGTLDKMAMMDTIMGNVDRHGGNFMVTPGQHPYVHLIDNGFTFNNRPPPRNMPGYWQYLERNDPNANNRPLHPEAARWLQQLDPHNLKQHLERLGVPPELANERIRRLVLLKNRVAEQRPNDTKLSVFNSPFEGQVPDGR